MYKRQEDVPVELYKEFMGDLSEEIERENKIINDLLSLVKMDKTADTMNISSVNINTLVERILKQLRPIAAKNNICLLYTSDSRQWRRRAGSCCKLRNCQCMYR